MYPRSTIIHWEQLCLHPASGAFKLGFRKEERYIIEDDYDCEFRYRSRSIPALGSMDSHESVIYMNTFSKTLTPAIRISYMVLPEKLMRRYIDTANFYCNTASTCEQYALARFIENGYFERHLSRLKKFIMQKENVKAYLKTIGATASSQRGRR